MADKIFQLVLLTDGSSDATLEYPLRWLLGHHQFQRSFQILRADLTLHRTRPKTLGEKVQCTLELYQPDVLFIHRDAENQAPEVRRHEIHATCEAMELKMRAVPIVPVRMTEAWLLSDERAIRLAAGKPAGKTPLSLPAARRWESESDPKGILFSALQAACGLSGRRLKNFRPDTKRHLVAQETKTYEPLLQLRAFAKFSRDVAAWIQSLEG